MRTIRDVTRVITDLAKSAETDIAPIIQPTIPEGGYFGVPRAVFCYISFLGLLYVGWSGQKNKDGTKKHFGTTSQAKEFIKKVLGHIDNLYHVNGDLLYDLYRHGTVHIYTPKKMISKKYPKKTIEWLCYKGERESWQYYESKSIKFRHLQIIEWSHDRFILPLSINVLYFDLLTSMELYNQLVYKDISGDLLKKFSSIVDALDENYDITKYDFWSASIKLV